MKGFCVLLCFCFPALFGIVRSAESNVITLGISPQDESYYGAARIKCKDGSGAFSRERLNDNFCDCVDGTDEPGTSACPEGKFYCRNAGHTPLVVFSSRVNDGICDCCDGSDEYDGKIKCKNTCWEAGKATREKLKKKLMTFKEGCAIRKKDVEYAKQMIEKEKVELASLKDEEKQLKKSVEELKEVKEAIEKAEEEERQKREQEEQRQKEAEILLKEKEASPPGNSSTQNDELLKETHKPAQQDSESSLQESESKSHKECAIESHNQSTDDLAVEDISEEEEYKKDETEGLSREELGRLVASRWTGEKSSHRENNDKYTAHEHDEEIKKTDSEEHDQHEHYEDYSSEEEESYNDHEEEDDEVDDKGDEYNENSDDDHLSDNHDQSESDEGLEVTGVQPSAVMSWWGKIQQSFWSVLRAIKISRPIDMSKATIVRKEYDDLSHKLSKVQSRISSLEKKLKQDFGADAEFYSFYNSCFQQKENKYNYKVCPYKQASQVEGHSTTNLGRWVGFKDSYRFMEFSSGDRCWNGPDRSMKVRLKCGLRNELIDVDEPSRCEYEATLLTPSQCREEKLLDLEKRLDSLNQNVQPPRDEL